MPTLSETEAYGIHASLPTFDATCHQSITETDERLFESIGESKNRNILV
jgi:hypothetical protein